MENSIINNNTTLEQPTSNLKCATIQQSKKQFPIRFKQPLLCGSVSTPFTTTISFSNPMDSKNTRSSSSTDDNEFIAATNGSTSAVVSIGGLSNTPSSTGINFQSHQHLSENEFLYSTAMDIRGVLDEQKKSSTDFIENYNYSNNRVNAFIHLIEKIISYQNNLNSHFLTVFDYLRKNYDLKNYIEPMITNSLATTTSEEASTSIQPQIQSSEINYDQYENVNRRLPLPTNFETFPNQAPVSAPVTLHFSDNGQQILEPQQQQQHYLHHHHSLYRRLFFKKVFREKNL